MDSIQYDIITGGLILFTFIALYPLLKSIYFSVRGPSRSMKAKLMDKHIFITGASQGLGKELASILALEYNAKVSIAARRDDLLNRAKQEIEGEAVKRGLSQAKIAVCPCDVTNEESVNMAIKKAKYSHGDIDVFIACAGSAILGYFHEMPLASFKKEVDLNYLGVVIPLRSIVSSWIDRFQADQKPLQDARFVLVSSSVGLTSFIGYSAYSPTKFALRGLAESLRSELKPYGVKVHISYPGNMDTPGFQEENKTKPRPTLAIEETFAPEPADKVARSLINGILLEQFNVYCDDIGSALLGRLMGGTAPRNSLILDVILSPLITLLSGLFRVYCDRIASKFGGKVHSS